MLFEQNSDLCTSWFKFIVHKPYQYSSLLNFKTLPSFLDSWYSSLFNRIDGCSTSKRIDLYIIIIQYKKFFLTVFYSYLYLFLASEFDSWKKKQNLEIFLVSPMLLGCFFLHNLQQICSTNYIEILHNIVKLFHKYFTNIAQYCKIVSQYCKTWRGS